MADALAMNDVVKDYLSPDKSPSGTLSSDMLKKLILSDSKSIKEIVKQLPVDHPLTNFLSSIADESYLKNLQVNGSFGTLKGQGVTGGGRVGYSQPVGQNSSVGVGVSGGIDNGKIFPNVDVNFQTRF